MKNLPWRRRLGIYCVFMEAYHTRHLQRLTITRLCKLQTQPTAFRRVSCKTISTKIANIKGSTARPSESCSERPLGISEWRKPTAVYSPTTYFRKRTFCLRQSQESLFSILEILIICKIELPLSRCEWGCQRQYRACEEVIVAA